MILYVAKHYEKDEYCIGSQKCISLIHSKNIDSIKIQDVNKLISENIKLPNWLNGTPILVDKKTGEVFKGTDAVQKINSLKNKIPKEISSENIEGVLPNGLTFCESSDEPLGVFPDTTELPAENGKITEQDLELYMRKRNGL